MLAAGVPISSLLAMLLAMRSCSVKFLPGAERSITPLNVSAALQDTRLGHALVGSNDYSLSALTPPGYLSGAANCGTGVTACVNILGHQMAHAPHFSVQIGYLHDFHLAGGAIVQPRVNFHYETESWLSMFNAGAGDKQTAYTRTDLGLRYTTASSKWYFEAYVQNAENGNIRTSAGSNGTKFLAQYLPPRTFGLNLGYNF